MQLNLLKGPPLRDNHLLIMTTLRSALANFSTSLLCKTTTCLMQPTTKF